MTRRTGALPVGTEHGGGLRSRRPSPRPLILTAVLLGLVTLVATGLEAGLEWDEAVYLAEVMPGVTSAGMGPHRARGISLLAAPVAWIGSIWVLRAYLLCAWTAMLAYAFSSWRPHIPTVAVIVGSGLLGLSWQALLYPTELSPNLWVAGTAVALMAQVRPRPGRGVGHLVALGSLATALFLLRPVDAMIVTVGAIGTALATPEPADRPAIAAVVGGSIVGASAWSVEAFLRFGGPIARLQEAGALVARDTDPVVQHLRLLDGPLMGPDPDPTLSWSALVWFGVLALTAVLATVHDVSRRGARGSSLLPVTLTATALAAVYANVGVLAPRFLLPAVALLAVPAGAGIARAQQRIGRVGTGVVIALLLPMVVWNVGTAARLHDEQVEARAEVDALAAALPDVYQPPCSFASVYAWPQLQVATGCNGRRFDSEDPLASFDALARRHAKGETTFVLSPTPIAPRPSGWRQGSLELRTKSTWHAYTRDTGLTAPRSGG